MPTNPYSEVTMAKPPSARHPARRLRKLLAALPALLASENISGFFCQSVPWHNGFPQRPAALGQEQRIFWSRKLYGKNKDTKGVCPPKIVSISKFLGIQNLRILQTGSHRPHQHILLLARHLRFQQRAQRCPSGGRARQKQMLSEVSSWINLSQLLKSTICHHFMTID